MERARNMSSVSQLDRLFWVDVVITTCYLLNRSLCNTLETKPYEVWTCKKPSNSHLRVFGREAYVHVPIEK